MTDALLVLCTCRDRQEASRIAHAVVDERLAACANIVGGINSIFRWQGEISEEEEVQLFVKTANHRYPALEKRIAELHSYETPEIVAIPIAMGSEKYLQWLQAQV